MEKAPFHRQKIGIPKDPFGIFGLFLQEQPCEMDTLGREVLPCVARSPLPPGSTFYILPVCTEFIWGLKGKNQTLCSVNVGRDASFHVSLDPSPRKEVEAVLPAPHALDLELSLYLLR